MARWRIYDQFRKRGAQVQRPPHPEDSSDRTDTVERIPDPTGSVLDAIWEEEWQVNLVRAALERVAQQIQPKHYQVFDRYVLRQQSVDQIVAALGVTPDPIYQVKRRVLRLIEAEVKRLEQQGL